MPTFTTTIVLTGLIALVPNERNSPSFATAYLVNDSMHTPVLRIYGNVDLENEVGANECKKIEGCEKEWIVECDLKDTVVSLGGADEQVPRLLPKKPIKELPDPPDNQSERGSKDWIVRMSNIEDGIGTAKADVQPYVTSSIKFGWDTMESSELDGSEEGASKVAKIGFKPSAGPPSNLKQAVAEQVRLRTTIKRSNAIISVKNKNSKFSAITVLCAKNNCFTMEIENSLPPTYIECDPTKEGLHFDKYYNLVVNQGHRMLPYSLTPRNCVKIDDDKIVDLQLLDSGLGLLKPVIPKAYQKIIRNLETLKDQPRNELVKIINGTPRTTPKQRLCSKDLIFHQLQVQNRVICPPVVLEAQ